MPVHVICGKKSGPTVFLCAAVHGDEINGVEIIREVMESLEEVEISGTVIAVPIVNVFGFNNQSRYLPDRRDLNRSFPGSKTGSLASRMAHLFVKEIVSKCSYGIDFHTGAIHRSNYPQLRVDTSNAKALEFAKAFGAPIIVDSSVRDGSLRETSRKRGVVTLVYEAGEALRFEDEPIRFGKYGCLRALNKIGINPLKPKAIKSDFLKKSTVLKDGYWVRAPIGGTLRLLVKLGKHVKKGEKIGVVSSPFEKAHLVIKAEDAGYIIGINNLPLVTIGTAVVHIATPDDPSKSSLHNNATVDEFVS